MFYSATFNPKEFYMKAGLLLLHHLYEHPPYENPGYAPVASRKDVQ